MRFDRESSPPCRLCFRGASDEQVEHCRIEPDHDGIEQALLTLLGASADDDWESTIAHALLPQGIEP